MWKYMVIAFIILAGIWIVINFWSVPVDPTSEPTPYMTQVPQPVDVTPWPAPSNVKG